jgi:hypothetical protein
VDCRMPSNIYAEVCMCEWFCYDKFGLLIYSRHINMLMIKNDRSVTEVVGGQDYWIRTTECALPVQYTLEYLHFA